MSASPAKPTIWSDHYEWVRTLGQGAHGVVYLVRDRQTGKRLALKLCLNAQDPTERQRFVREARILLQLQTVPRLVRIARHFLTADQPFFVMPFAEGGSLTAQLGTLNFHQAVAATLHISEALAALHHANVVHRDVKPDNALIVADGTCVLADLGVAYAPLHTAHVTRQGWGTDGYRAPELEAGGYPSAASDAYSLGATFYHLVTKQSPAGLARPLRPGDFGHQVPSWAASWMQALTAFHPQARPTVPEFAKQLAVHHRQHPARLPLPPDLTGLLLGGALVGGLLLALNGK